MVDELTTTGLSIDDFATRLNIITGELRTAISALLDFGEDQPTGQLTRILTEHQQQLAELLQEIYSGIDPDQATGQTLDAICSITGTYRQAATFGTVPLELTFTGAGTAPAGALCAVAGDPDNQWALDADVVAAGAGNETGTATCTTSGAVQALINTISVIVTPAANWSGVVNTADATEGRDRETDTALRLRREIEVTTGGSTSADAVAAAVSAMTGMLAVVVYENDTWRAVSPMPPHSIEVVYWDGGAGAVAAADLAEEIFEEKAGGIQAYGTTITAHEDTQGNTHQIGHTLADEQATTVTVNLTQDTDYQGDAALTAAIVAWALAELSIGDDVYRSQISGLAIDAGALNVTSVLLDGGGADITIGAREIATIAAVSAASPW